MTYWYILLHFPRKWSLTFLANRLKWRQFAWNVKSCFLQKNKRNITNLSSIELAQRVIKVKWRHLFYRDSWGRICCEVVAIDALVIHDYKVQFQQYMVKRELNKVNTNLWLCPRSSGLPTFPNFMPYRIIVVGNYVCLSFHLLYVHPVTIVFHDCHWIFLYWSKKRNATLLNCKEKSSKY